MPQILPFIDILRILSFSNSRAVTFSVVARILPDPDSPLHYAITRLRADSTLFQYPIS